MTTPSPDVASRPWLLLIHQIPPKPDYFRVKVGRRFQSVGAVAIKSSVYVLPATEQAMEDFQWILREIVEGRGEASISRSTFVDALTDQDIERFSHDARSRDYEAILAEARATLETVPSRRRLNPEQRASAEQAISKGAGVRALLWQYQHAIPIDVPLCCGHVSRAVAVAAGKVFFATANGLLIAL